jgi:thiol-disulfide isomerase/thioredoxin
MTSTGLIVAAAVLVIGTIVGLWRQRNDGRLRSAGPANGSAARRAAGGQADSGKSRETDLVVASSSAAARVAGPSEASATPAQESAPPQAGRPNLESSDDGLAASDEVLTVSDDGAMAIVGVSQPAAGPGDSRSAADPSAAGERLDATLLATLGVGPADATLLQFSSAFCAPCRALRRVSSEVAALLPGVQHVEVDAESHLDAVRALGIWRTPTLLVLDADGRVTKRATGVPGKPQLIAVLGDILPAA